MSGGDETIKKMASLLRSGATMLETTCPSCNVPLFRLKTGDVVCPSCGQRFILVQSDEEELEAYGDLALQELERNAIEKIRMLTYEMKEASDYQHIKRAAEVTLDLLKILRATRSLRKKSS